MKPGIIFAVVVAVFFSALGVAASSSVEVRNSDRDQPDSATQHFSREIRQWEVGEDATILIDPRGSDE